MLLSLCKSTIIQRQNKINHVLFRCLKVVDYYKLLHLVIYQPKRIAMTNTKKFANKFKKVRELF